MALVVCAEDQMTEGFGQLTVGQLRESGVQPLVHRTDRFDNASRKSRAPTLTGCDRSFCLTLRWRNRIRTIGPALAKGLSAVAEGSSV